MTFEKNNEIDTKIIQLTKLIMKSIEETKSDYAMKGTDISAIHEYVDWCFNGQVDLSSVSCSHSVHLSQWHIHQQLNSQTIDQHF